MARIFRVASLSGVVLAIGLASASWPSYAVQDGSKIEVIHWFTSKSEAAGIKALADALETRGVKWVDTAIAGGDAAKAAAINRTQAGDPPGALQLNTGKELDDIYANGLVRNVDDVAAKGHWKDILPSALYNAVVRDGHVVAIPINNYAQNRLFYSKAVLSEVGVVEPPKTWDEMFSVLDKLKAKGLIPLALGAQPWQERVLFNAVLIGVGGKDLFAKIWHDNDPDAINSDEFRKSVEIFGRLRAYVDPASANREWNQTTLLLAQKKAAFQFMGDWAKGELVAAGQHPGVDFGGIFGPGQPIFIFGGDVFVLPVSTNEALKKAQDIFADVVFGKEAQTKASLEWGSIPARTDVDLSNFDAIAGDGVEAMRDPTRNSPDPNVLATSDNVSSLTDLIAEYWATSSMDVQTFVARWSETAALARK